MTHRSRSGGPQQTYTQRKKTNGQSQPNGRKGGPSTTASTSKPPVDSATPVERHPLTITPSANGILALIRHALAHAITSPEFVPTVQKIKVLLYEKKWLDAFGDESLLEAYAGRWVPSRALCFRELLAESDEVRSALFGEVMDGEAKAGPSRRRVVSLGGGAGSELLAVAALIHGQRTLEKQKETAVSDVDVEWIGVDYGPWSGVLDKFTDACTSLWSIDLRAKCHQLNLLNTTASESLRSLLTQNTRLVTLLFTMCELMSQSRASTIRLLHDLASQLEPDGLLLVADSASDIAEFELGSSGRKWPVYMVLDAVMLGMKTESGERQWEKVESEDSRWFRLAEGAGSNWPVKLENTRYWYRLYRRV